DEHVGRHVLCPACNGLVVIPAPGATVTTPVARVDSLVTNLPPSDDQAEEVVGPVYFRLRKRATDPNRSTGSKWIPLEGPILPSPEEKVRRRRKRIRRQIVWKRETHWYECLAYPFRAWTLLVGLGVGQAIALASAASFLPQLVEWLNGPGG